MNPVEARANLQRVLDAHDAGQASDYAAALLVACIGASRNAAAADGKLSDAAQSAAFKKVSDTLDVLAIPFDNAALLKAGAATVKAVPAALSAEFDANEDVKGKGKTHPGKAS